MNTHPRELTFIYNKDKSQDRKFLARAKAVRLKIHEIDITKIPIIQTQLAEIAYNWGISVHTLVDTQKYRRALPQDPHEVLKILVSNPMYLRTPIAIKNREYCFLRKFSDLQQLEDFHNPFESEPSKHLIIN